MARLGDIRFQTKDLSCLPPTNSMIGMEPEKTYKQKIEILKDKVIQKLIFENQYYIEENRILKQTIESTQRPNITAIQRKSVLPPPAGLE